MSSSSFSKKIFTFFVCQPLNRTFSPSDWKNFRLGKWDVFFPQDCPVSQINNSEKSCIFIGYIFSLNTLDLETTDGLYIGISLDHKTGRLTIFRNANSHLGIFYSMISGSPVFWGDYSWGKDHLPYNRSIDQNSIHDLLTHGTIGADKTFYTSVKKFPFRQKATLIDDKLLFVDQTPIVIEKDLHRSSKNFYDFVLHRLGLWIRHIPFKSIALSGGADSRLIAAALKEHKPSDLISVHSRLHPRLNTENDADVFIAKQICHYLDIPHEVQSAISEPSAYLSQDGPAKTPILSGLYGGEYLGGEAFYLIKNHSNNFETSNLFSSRLEIIANSFSCDIYGGAWFATFFHHNLTVTPFLDSYIVEHLLSISDKFIINYNLYNQLLQHLPKALKDMPLQSQMTEYHTQGWQTDGRLINPKSIPLDSPALPTSLEAFVPRDIDQTTESFLNRKKTLYLLLKFFKEIE